MNLKKNVFKKICIFIILLLILSTSVMANNDQQVSDVKQYDLEKIGMKISLQNNFIDIIESMENNDEKVSNIENKDEYLKNYKNSGVLLDAVDNIESPSKEILVVCKTSNNYIDMANFNEFSDEEKNAYKEKLLETFEEKEKQSQSEKTKFSIKENSILKTDNGNNFISIKTSLEKEEKVLDKYEAGKMVYDDLLKNLAGAVSDTVWNCRDGFIPVLKNLLPTVNGKPCFDNKTLLKLAGGLSQRDENALVQTDKKGNIEYDPETKDTEIVKGTDTIEEYMAREVLPHIPDAVWFFEEDAKKGTVKTGAEIPFTRYFFKYQRPETMEALQAKIMESQSEIEKDLDELFE